MARAGEIGEVQPVDSADVIVVGGGVVGCAAAFELARDVDVLVLESDAIAGGATGKASGLVSPVYDHRANLDAARYATAFFRSFDGTRNLTFTERPGVFCFAADERTHAVEASRVAADAGFDTAILDPDGLEREFPGVFNTGPFDGAAVFHDTGWVDSYTFATALQKEAEDRGATVETGVTVESVTTVNGEVSGVTTTEGRYEAGTVVAAAGWRTRSLLAEHLRIPVRPFRYQTATLEIERALDAAYPMAWEHGTRLYWRPTRSGSLHVGGQPYFVETPGSVRQSATDAFTRLVATAIPEYLCDLGEPRLQGTDTCKTGAAATPDTLPIIDEPPAGPDGLVLATGMHGFGIMLAPVAGAGVRSLVTGAEVPFPLDPYRLGRFDDRSESFGSAYIQSAP
ncbi:MAG: NAD(P)/FAD-dependent oxidoreductase [Halodesulfurarchaeum sp.]